MLEPLPVLPELGVVLSEVVPELPVLSDPALFVSEPVEGLLKLPEFFMLPLVVPVSVP